MPEVSFALLDSDGFPPERARPGDAGFDLRSTERVELGPGEWRMVPTGVAVAIPDGHAGLVLPRSGHAARHGVGLVNSPGLIDSGYRGEVRVLLINHGREPVRFEPGDRIAQLVVVALPAVTFVPVDRLETSDRGAGGFGSTGR